MLELPPGWPSWSIQCVVAHLMRHADAHGAYATASRAIVRAALDFVLAGPRWAGRDARKRGSLIDHANGWALNDWLIYILPRVDDDAFEELGAALSGLKGQVDMIAPPWASSVTRFAVKGMFPRAPVDVYSIDSYVDLRIGLASLDMQVLCANATSDLLRRYSGIIGEQFEDRIDAAALRKPG